MPKTDRRALLKAAALLSAASLYPSRLLANESDPSWSAGEVAHLIPAVNHERLLLKVSFRSPRSTPPSLVVGSGAGRRLVRGSATDTAGQFFQFDVPDLAPATEYELRLVDGDVRASPPLCDAWTVRTFPAPSARPQHFRLLAFTCAGGHPDMMARGLTAFRPLEIRRRLLQRALSFQPDAAIAIGDHVYWDQRSWLDNGGPRAELTRAFYAKYGELDREQRVLGTQNEVHLKRAVGPQISELYGTLLRSTPSFFVNDDHDYFENDEANERMVTFPPAAYQLDLARTTRNLYLPEFLPDAHRPVLMSGSGAADRPTGVAESFGTLRYGSLVEALIYDCARHLSLKGPLAGLVPDEAERWLIRRTLSESADDGARHLLHVPSHPFGWSAGKWREWYPDAPDVGGSDEGQVEEAVAARLVQNGDQFGLTTDREKYFWQEGWFRQHQRLLEAMSAQKNRAAVVLSGDLHAVGHSRLERSGDLDLSGNPVHAVLTGSPGCNSGWPSIVRGTFPMAASAVSLETVGEVKEKNGFSILDITDDEIELKLFAWERDPSRSLDVSAEFSRGDLAEIDRLQPYHVERIRR